MAGCSESSGDLGFSIYADPARTHAPGDVHFELTRDDGQPVDNCIGKWVFGDGIEMSGDYMADHRYRKSGSYAVSVDLTCDGVSGYASTDVEVYGSVDLSVGALEARPLDVSTNGNIAVSAAIFFQILQRAGHPERRFIEKYGFIFGGKRFKKFSVPT